MLLPTVNVGLCGKWGRGITALLAFPIMSTMYMLCLVLGLGYLNSGQSWCPACYRFNTICMADWCEST
jgi:hypothetical protein